MMAVNAAGTVISERGLLCRFLCHPMAPFRSFQAVGAFGELTYKPLIHKHLSQWGHVAEWLRNGLQNRVHQFNSGRGLHTQPIDFAKIFSSQAVPSGIHDRCPEMAASIYARKAGCQSGSKDADRGDKLPAK
jgi:hypothetical protein